MHSKVSAIPVNADLFAPVDGDRLPTGEVHSVQGKPWDLRKPIPIGQRMGTGHSTNYLLGAAQRELRHAAHVHEPFTGRTMDVHTTEPALLLYTGNGFEGRVPRDVGKGGAVYARHAGLALETQHLPDSPNIAAFPSTVLRPGERLHTLTRYRFSVTARSTWNA